MTLTEEQFAQLCATHSMTQTDAQAAMDFAYDLLQSEAKAVGRAEPEAINTIRNLEIAAQESYVLASNISAEKFNEV